MTSIQLYAHNAHYARLTGTADLADVAKIRRLLAAKSEISLLFGCCRRSDTGARREAKQRRCTCSTTLLSSPCRQLLVSSRCHVMRQEVRLSMSNPAQEATHPYWPGRRSARIQQ